MVRIANPIAYSPNDMLIPFCSLDGTALTELGMLVSKRRLKTKAFLRAFLRGGRILGWPFDDAVSRDLDGYDATASSGSVRAGYCGGIRGTLCAFRPGIRDRNGLRGRSTHDSHDDHDHSSDHDRLSLTLPGPRSPLGLPTQSGPRLRIENQDIWLLCARVFLRNSRTPLLESWLMTSIGGRKTCVCALPDITTNHF